jgi:uncharacterized membrane protein
LRLESHAEYEEQRFPAAPESPVLNRAAAEAARRWLARFAPLLEGVEALTADECRRRLAQIETLRAEGQGTLATLELQAAQADVPLLTTLRDALRELDALESDHRRQLGLLAPGDPAAHVNLERLRARLAETAAKREVTSWSGGGLGADAARLELVTAPANWTQAVSMGVFSLGWLAFTTVHALFMIGGMFAAFGFPALALLLFYSMFWGAGLAMGWGALKAASPEEVELRERELTVRRRFPFGVRERTYRLGPRSRAYVRDSPIRQQGTIPTEVTIHDGEGTEITVAAGRPQVDQQRLVEQINGYLGVPPG